LLNNCIYLFSFWKLFSFTGFNVWSRSLRSFWLFGWNIFTSVNSFQISLFFLFFFSFFHRCFFNCFLFRFLSIYFIFCFLLDLLVGFFFFWHSWWSQGDCLTVGVLLFLNFFLFSFFSLEFKIIIWVTWNSYSSINSF